MLLLLLVLVLLLLLGMLLLLLVLVLLLLLGMLLLLLVLVLLLLLGVLLLLVLVLLLLLGMLLLPLILVLLLTFVLLLVLVLLLTCVDWSCGPEKQEQDSRTYKSDSFHWKTSVTSFFVLNSFFQFICEYHSLDFRSIPRKSAHPAYQVDDHHDEQHRADYPHAPATPPSGIPVITAASAKQKHQKN